MSLARRLLITAVGTSFALPNQDLFAMFNGGQTGNDYAIGQADFDSLTGTWTESPSNPVISASGAGWVSGHVKDPCVMADGLSVYVSGYNGSRYQIGRLTRPDTSSTIWTYDSTSTPAIALGSAGDPDEHGCAFPTVLDEGSGPKRFKMWYRGEDASGVLSVCYAYSADGETWTKIGQVLTKGAPGSWEDVGVGPGAIVKDGSTYYLFYGGYQSASAPVRWQTGVATFTDPEGTYTKSGSNPVLTASFGTSGVSQLLTANTNTGSATVQVGDTSHWADGWSLILVDSDSESEIHTITVDSGTQITLDANVLANFTTAHGATIRPVDFNSTYPRSVLAMPGGGWQMFWTPFQPQDDLSPGGTALREMSMRATAASLTGSWTKDWATGLLFPLYPASTGWHKFSAENPSVIVAP